MSITLTNAEVSAPTNSDAESNAVCCTWCKLPLAGVRQEPGPVSATTSNSGQRDDIYCCFGCRMAHAITEESGREGEVRWTVVRLGIAIFFSMNLMAFTMTMWSLNVYDVQRDPFQTQLFEVFRWLSMVFSLPVLLLLGVPLLRDALISWRQRVFSTDLLIATGVTAAYVISVINVLQGTETIYFEVGATVLVMVTLGRWFEATGKQKATEALDQLAALLPAQSRRVTQDEVTEISSSEIVAGDRLQIRAGERFPTDAVLVEGFTTVDEQVFTGESTPLSRSPGDRILGGTVNLDGHVVVEATAAFRAGSFGQLLRLLQHARLSRGYYQRIADRVASWFFPLVSGVALLALIIHWHDGAGVAVQVSLSVLLIACPCSLGLATPLAVWTALSVAAKHQVLFRSGEAIERLGTVKAVCFDKTGTLTTGTPQVKHLCVLDDHDSAKALRLSEALARTSAHPFSQAIVRFVESAQGRAALSGTDLQQPSTRFAQVCSVPGGGVEAYLPSGPIVRLGSLNFVTSTESLEPRLKLRVAHACAMADQQAASIVAMSVGGRPQILFLVTETMRPEASPATKSLIDLSFHVTVLSGDRSAKAEQLRRNLLDCHTPGCQCSAECAELHVTEQEDNHDLPRPAENSQLAIACDLSPAEKVSMLQEIRKRHGAVAMVGDGINDAPALAASDVGIAMGCGADVSRDSGQICLLSNDLSRIPWAIHLARRTRSVIRQNLFWAFGYNSVGVMLAAFGVLNPASAAGLMIVSSLLVISNSLRLMSEAPAETSKTSHENSGFDGRSQRLNPDRQDLKQETVS